MIATSTHSWFNFDFRTAQRNSPQIVDLAPVHNNHVKLVFLNQRHCRFAAAHNLRRHLQLVQHIPRGPRELYVGAKQQSVHFKCRLPGAFHFESPVLLLTQSAAVSRG